MIIRYSRNSKKATKTKQVQKQMRGDGVDGIVSEGVGDVVDVDVSGGEDCGNAKYCYAI